MDVRGTWKSAESGRTVMIITDQNGPLFSGHYYTSKGDVPDDKPFPVYGFVTSIGGQVRRIAWTVCWDLFHPDHAERSHFSSVAGWAGRVVQSGAKHEPETIDAMWLLSADPSHGMRVGDDREWASVRIGGDLSLVRAQVNDHRDLPADSASPPQYLKNSTIIGKWKNQLGSILEVSKQNGSHFEGTFATAVGNVPDTKTFPVIGQISQLGHPAYARFGFSVCFDVNESDSGRSSVGLFCGRLVSAAASPTNEARLETLWIVSHDPTPTEPEEKPEPDNGEWRTKSIGRDVFHRV